MYNKTWDNKEQRIRIFSEILEKESTKNDNIVIFTHANIIKLFINKYFRDTVDLKLYSAICPTASMTILTKFEKERW